MLGLPEPPVEEGTELPALPAPPEQNASAGSSGGDAVGHALVALESPAAPLGVSAPVPPAPLEEGPRVEDHKVSPGMVCWESQAPTVSAR